MSGLETKAPNNSVPGLGLHIAFNIVKYGLKGQISCTSVEGDGTKILQNI